VASVRLRLDPGTRLVDDGAVVIGGSPLGLFRLSRSGAAIARQLSAAPDGLRVAELPAGHRRLTDRLLAAGALHPVPDAGDGPPAGDVTVVIPVRLARSAPATAPAGLLELVAAARGEGVREVVIVDDASPVPVPPIEGARIVRLDRNVGPGGARNNGAATAVSPLVAFVDADTSPRPGWLAPLLTHLADDRVGLVAPRIVAPAQAHGRLARFEQWRSPLDLGPGPARIRAGSRVSYVPAAALLVRVEVFRAMGGFDAGLRFGEDVDLVWRIDEAGWGCRYEPISLVEHATRSDLRQWVRQRYEYGTSAAPLAERHPGALAPARVGGWSVLAWATAALVNVPAGIALGAGTSAALARKLRPMQHPYAEAFRLAGLGNLFAGRILASALLRAWWPFAVAAVLVSRRARRVVLAAALVPALVDWARDRPPIDPASATALRLLDDLAYGTGVWAGSIRRRTAAPLVPDLGNWPGKR